MDLKISAKQTVKVIASPVLDFCGVYDALLSRRVFSRPTWVILMYHRVVDASVRDPFNLGMCVSIDLFEEQVRYHVERFTPITMADAAARIRSGRPLPHAAVSFTFDDGYEDFATHALPILERHHCPSTLYVTTSGLEEGRPFWWERVVNAFRYTDSKSLDIGFLLNGNASETIALSPRNRRRMMLLVKELLWRQPAEKLEEMVNVLCARLNVMDASTPPPARLSCDDVKRVARRDVEIAAHCDMHVDMRRQPDTRIDEELVFSRQMLRDLTGQRVDGFAYPGGRQDARVRQRVAKAGFTYAAGTERGVNRQPYDLFNLHRIGMPNIGIWDYKRCLATAAGATSSDVQPARVPLP